MRARSASLALSALVAATVGCADSQGTGPGKNQAAASFIPVYLADFSSGIAGPEWSHPLTTTAPLGERFLGEFCNDSVTLSLTGLAPHDSVSVALDFYIIRSWDGVGPNWAGPDEVTIKTDGTRRGVSTFSNIAGKSQHFPDATVSGHTHAAQTGATGVNTLGYTYWDGVPLDATYHYAFKIPHTAGTLSVDFIAKGLQDINDESWGLDNIVIAIGS
ncbi:MAG TPA: hypothetical protein VE967_00910 [Gemmatimonadaceae bacterium]|nr:hypothetical protein [Gemmatimonadaceae bacterium]